VFGTIGTRGHKRFAHSSVKFLFSGGEGGPFNWREYDDPDVLWAQVIQEVTAEGEQLARVGDGRGFKILVLESQLVIKILVLNSSSAGSVRAAFRSSGASGGSRRRLEEAPEAATKTSSASPRSPRPDGIV
jgi:hypothetical protein